MNVMVAVPVGGVAAAFVVPVDSFEKI